MALNENLVNIQARHFTFLQRLSASEFNKFSVILDQIRQGILSRIPDNLTSFSRKRLDKQLAALNKFQLKLYDNYTDDLFHALSEIALNESKFEVKVLNSIVLPQSSLEFAAPSEAQILAALRSSPLSVGNNGSGKLLKPFINDWKRAQTETVNGIIRQGWFEGQTVNQMARGVRDSISGQTTRTAKAIIRTSINHVSQVARNITWGANEDIITGWRFVAVLDSRTSNECRGIASLNRVYPLGKGPFPPRHPNCRSTSIPEIDERFATDVSSATRASKGASGGKQVSASMNDYDWLKAQPAEFIDDAIGPTLGKALRSGKLSAAEFGKFTLNARLEPLTITEMIEKDKRLNLGLFD